MNKKLTDKQKREIISLVKDTTLTYGEIAESYNVGARSISGIACKAGIRRRGVRSDKGTKKTKEKPVQPEAIKTFASVNLLENLQESYDELDCQVRKWETIKHEACQKLDGLRKARQEHYIAIQALQRANEANGNGC